jgi:hypothetical protein
VTTPGTTAVLASEDDETTAEAAYAAGLDAVSRLYDDAMELIARLAESADEPDDEVGVLRMVQRPPLAPSSETAAA